MLRLVLLSALLAAGAAHAAQQADLAQLRSRIAALQREFDKTAESKSGAQDQLRISELAISDSNRRLRELALQRQAANVELGQIRARTDGVEREVQGQEALLGRLLYQQYLDGGDQEYLRLLLNNDDPNQVARNLRYYEYITRSRASILKSLRDSLAKFQALTEQTRRKRNDIGALETEERAQRAHLEQDKRTRRQLLDKFAVQLARQRHEIGRLQRNESHLSQLTESLAHLLPDDRQERTPFSSLKGKLTLPVKGRLLNRFGAKRPESTMAWTGWFLRATPEQPVKAVASGRVVYADWLRGFGNLLIIDHGDGYMSLYGNNETLYKQVGDTLHAGDIVAAVGSSGGNEDSGLYFELRFEGKPFDPNKWVRH